MRREAKMSEGHRAEILRLLIQMRKEGKLFGVWCDSGRLRVQYEPIGHRPVISWEGAERLVGLQPEFATPPPRKKTLRPRTIPQPLRREQYLAEVGREEPTA